MEQARIVEFNERLEKLRKTIESRTSNKKRIIQKKIELLLSDEDRNDAAHSNPNEVLRTRLRFVKKSKRELVVLGDANAREQLILQIGDGDSLQCVSDLEGQFAASVQFSRNIGKDHASSGLVLSIRDNSGDRSESVLLLSTADLAPPEFEFRDTSDVETQVGSKKIVGEFRTSDGIAQPVVVFTGW